MENDTNTRQTVYYGNYVDDNSCAPKDNDMCPDLKPKGKCQINIFCGGKKDKKCIDKNDDNCQINIFCDPDADKKYYDKNDGECHINIFCGNKDD